MGKLDETIRRLGEEHGILVFGFLAFLVFWQTASIAGPLVPGNPILIGAGMMAMSLSQPLWAVTGLLILAASVGALVNYATGRWLGPRLTPRLPAKHVDRTEAFFRRHGDRTVGLAMFVPFVRSFAPFLAGSSGVPLRRFLTAALVGSMLWVTAFVLAGATVGTISWVSENLGLMVIGLVGLVASGMVVAALRSRRRVAVEIER